MRRILLAALLALAIPVAAHARPPMETNQLVDGEGTPLGTAANPLNVTGAAGSGGAAGSVTPAGTNGTNAQAVQGIVGGVPQRVTPEQPDGVVSTYTVTGTGQMACLPLAGYVSALVELTGTFSASLTTQVSTDTTTADCSDGVWTDAFGLPPENTGTTATSATLNTSTRRREYRAQDGAFMRINTSTFSSGAVVVKVVRKIAPIGERSVYVGGGNINATSRLAGTNRSATVGTTASPLMTANTSRQGWKVKNDTASDIWINFDTTATAAAGSGNIKIAAGAYLASEPGYCETGAMSVIGAAAGLAITAREY